VEEAALGILEVADAAMERAIRVVSVERGHDPREFALLAFGGAGPLHGVSLARRLGIPTVLIPPTAGVLSALGLLLAELGHERSQGLVRPLRDLAPAELAALLRRLRREAADGLPGLREGLRFTAVAALRYVGQAHELDVPVPDGEIGPAWVAALERDFHEAHRRRYGHAAPEEPVELVALRVRASISAPPAALAPAFPPPPPHPKEVQAWFGREGPVRTRVLHRAELRPGDGIAGPAVVLGSDATTLLPPGSRGTVDPHGVLVVEVG
ncbi:MAG: hydantoinase/oxoprolinase family protein, partial [Candidatus Bipolaricaulota bacterium]|nr:hydantoinase/oxoprolinase family protein [Candidatus Bipolaricaulota bacterium]